MNYERLFTTVSVSATCALPIHATRTGQKSQHISKYILMICCSDLSQKLVQYLEKKNIHPNCKFVASPTTVFSVILCQTHNLNTYF